MKKDKFNLTGGISISRRTGDGYENTICIEIKDDSSRNRFIDVKMSLADFAAAISGCSEMPIQFEVRCLDSIGKTKETEAASINIPKNMKFSSREDIRKYLQAYHQRDGWVLDDYLGSQTSIKHIESDEFFAVANIKYFRYG